MKPGGRTGRDCDVKPSVPLPSRPYAANHLDEDVSLAALAEKVGLVPLEPLWNPSPVLAALLMTLRTG
jgi:hypothetical protein